MENGLTIIETEWGAQLTVADGTKLDDAAVFNTIGSLLNRLNEKQCRRILIDRSNNVDKKSFVALFTEVEQFLTLGGFGYKVGFIAPGFAGSKESKFVEDIGFNRGVDIRYFARKESAMNWLLG